MSTPAITEMTTDDLEKTITDKISLSEPEEDIDVSDDDLDDDEVPDIIDDNDIIAIDEKNKNIEEEKELEDESDDEPVEESDEGDDKVSTAKISAILEGDDDENESDDEDYDENSFQKLENDINTDKLLTYHPELLQSNYKEINALSKIARNKKGLIIDALHKTVPFLTKYERARVLGIRIKQLNNDADPFVEVPPNTIDARFIAEEELKQGKIPFIIRRPLPNGGNEYWKLSDLEVIEY
jgi:DNA-directed RNA polymerase subunit K/omega